MRFFWEKISFILLFIFCYETTVLAVSNQQVHSDSIIVFRFIPKDLTFYDSKELGLRESQLISFDLINGYKDDIIAEKSMVVVHDYGTSFHINKANELAINNSSNQVKSSFITSYCMKGMCYNTSSHVDIYRSNKVVADEEGVGFLSGHRFELRDGFLLVLPQLVQASIPFVRTPDSLISESKQSLTESEVIKKHEKNDSLTSYFPLIFKSNLIYDLMLAPSIEIEYMVDDHWSAAVETSIAWWHNRHKNWYYQIATLIPEVRYRINTRNAGRYHTVGLFGGAGWYDLEYKKTGYQGELWMVGASYSYTIPINRQLGLELGGGIGFMSAKHEEYLPIDGHYVYQQTSRMNFFGPLRLKCAMVFDVNSFLKRRGIR